MLKSALAKFSEAPGKVRESNSKFPYRKKKRNFVLLILLVWVKSSLCFYRHPTHNLDYNGLRFGEVQ